MVLKIQQKISLSYLNSLYEKLENTNETIDIRLPLKLVHTDFGLLFSFIQFISTWLRKDNSGDLYLPLKSKDQLKEYLHQEFAYPSIVLCWEKSILIEGNLDVKTELKPLSKDYYERMEYLKLKSKESIPIYCFDHDLSKRGYSRFFYNPNKKIVAEDELDFNLFPVFEKIGFHFNKVLFNVSIRPVLDNFIKITHELFLNTDEHARTNVHGFNLYPNIRSAYFKFHKRRLKNLIQEYEHSEGILNYLNTNLPLNDSSEVYLFEISILDSGPGLVRRFSNVEDLSEYSIEQEIEIIKACLTKHNTSSKGIDSLNKGLGLSRVLKTINNKGIIRIKSGRADVMRDLRNMPVKDTDSSEEILLLDWQNNSQKFTCHSEAEGTLITIIYPLGHE